MDEEVEMPPAFRQCREHQIEARFGADIGLQHKIAVETQSQRLHPLAQRLPLVGKGKFGAVIVQGFGDAPCNRALVGNTHNQTLLTRHQRHGHPHFSRRVHPTRTLRGGP